MLERRPLGQLGREPLYNTRAVVQATGVPADTFRAWERRYGVPHPHRTSGNQRLYSERDMGVIAWLRDRTQEGMTISQAIQRLRIEHADVFRPELASEPIVLQPAQLVPDPQLIRLRDRLIDAITRFDTLAGERVIDEALAIFSLEEACTRVIHPTLVEIGERWARNEVSVTAEHFATRLIVRRLSTIFNMVLPPTGRGTIVAACPPGEEHEVGLLILCIFLARRNWRVIYLGANVPTRDLIETVRQVNPDLVCLSAATAPSAEHALAVAQQIVSSVSLPPAVACGGRAFDRHQSLRREPGIHFLSGDPQHVADHIGTIIEDRHRSLRGTEPRGARG
jgi:MerR family transcriptional regulator, light-induced transcriptional regulator